MNKLRVAWLPIVGVIVSIAALAVALYNMHYNTTGTVEATKWNAVFYNGKKEAIIGTQKHWAKGKIYYGLYHYKGPTKTKYSIYYRKNSNSYVHHYTGSLAVNKKYYGDWYMHSTNSKDKYTYKLNKLSNTAKETRMKVEFGRK